MRPLGNEFAHDIEAHLRRRLYMPGGRVTY
jgi:hypothetical protein